jgi:NAD-specific glutamate dehydrogenase
MSNETYSSIRETLDRLGAPPGGTISERIESLLRDRTDAAARIVLAERDKSTEAMAALNAADVYTTGTVAHGIAYLAEQRNIATRRAVAAERATLRERQCAEKARADLARST